MAQILKLRRSAVPGNKPTISQLEFGEIAMNTYDGRLFMRRSSSLGDEVIEIGTNSSNINGTDKYIPIFSGSNTLITSSIYQDGNFTSIRNATSPEDPNNPDILYVNGDGVSTYNLISAHGNLDNYVQVNIQNYSSGSSASSDIVATADSGGENSGYIDMGINSSGYTNTNYVGAAGDAYVYSTGNNLYIGNAIPDKQLVLFNGGLDTTAHARVWIFDQGTVGINTDEYNTVNPPSLQIKAPNTSTYNLVQIEGEVNNYSQVGIINKSAGTNASADLALYNNIDPTGQLAGFVDLGINSTNRVYDGIYPGAAGDAYLFTDSDHLIIGPISASGNTRLTLFAGGISESENAKLTLFGNNQHQMSGSLLMSGSLTINSSLISNQTTSSISSGTKVVSINPTGSYTSAFYNYTITSGSNARSGQVITVWNRNNIRYTDNSTLDIGNTYGVEFTASLNSGNVQLSLIFPSSGWDIKTLVNFL